MRILVIGGTGTLGRAIIQHYYSQNNYIVCLSRDELKQQELKRDFPRVKCVLGDIGRGMPYNLEENIDIIYHVAALKHVDVLQSNVTVAAQTNIAGTMEAAQWAHSRNIPKFVFCSTDKAVLPINVYGQTKAIAEAYIQQLNNESIARLQNHGTQFRIFRWGNVLGSRGSVLHYFKRTLLEHQKVYLTHTQMTRFWIRIEDAIGFMTSRAESQSPMRCLQIPDGSGMKAARVIDIVRVIAERLGVTAYQTEVVGIRPGEKIHEDLVALHDNAGAPLNSATAPRYSDEELYQLLEGLV